MCVGIYEARGYYRSPEIYDLSAGALTNIISDGSRPREVLTAEANFSGEGLTSITTGKTYPLNSLYR